MLSKGQEEDTEVSTVVAAEAAASSESPVVLALRDIRVAYTPHHTTLELTSLDIRSGRVYAVVGANGAGKTTLFKVLTLLIQPQHGRVLWHGQDLMRTASVTPQTLRQQVVLVSQQPLLFRTSVFHNVAYGLKVRGVSRSDITRRVEAVLHQVQMADYAQRPAWHLSGGEIQRVALARALVLQPEVLLLDEPTANLDSHSRAMVEELIHELRQQRQHTLLFTTHDMSQAYRLSDEVIALQQGRGMAQPLENILRGTLVQDHGETCFTTGRLVVVLPGHYQEVSCIAIAPEDILLSPLPLASSARNRFAGQIVEMSTRGTQLNVVVDIGERLHVRITHQSYETLGLKVGEPIHVTFKASAVRVYE
ncbi:MAG: ATP-binding cassette domain-containing protein [Candidatus Tectomicrobia bacterium]